MSRRRKVEARVQKKDPRHSNHLVQSVVHRILKHGKKTLAYAICYYSLRIVKKRSGQNPLAVLRQAVRLSTPDLAMKSRRKGGANQQVPIELKTAQGKNLALRWILQSAKKRNGIHMAAKFSAELMDAARQTGQAIRKKEEMHRMAEANKVFSNVRY